MAYNSKLSTPQIEQALGAALLNEKNQYNITQDKGSNYPTLAEAIAAVSDDKYKVNGIVLTYNTGKEWVSMRYNGEDASGFSDEQNWSHETFKADDEDLEQTNGLMKFKDRKYDEANFSGKGYKILRKNIQEVSVPKFDLTISSGCTSDGNITITIGDSPVEVAVTTAAATAEDVAALIGAAVLDVAVEGAVVTFKSNPVIDYSTTGVTGEVADNTYTENRNVLIQKMINETNTVCEIRYDFDLNGAEIVVPEDCVLKFEGGSLRNGKVTGNKTVLSNMHDNCLLVNFSGSFADVDIYVSYLGLFPEGDGSVSGTLNQMSSFMRVGELIRSMRVVHLYFNPGYYGFGYGERNAQWSTHPAVWKGWYALYIIEDSLTESLYIHGNGAYFLNVFGYYVGSWHIVGNNLEICEDRLPGWSRHTIDGGFIYIRKSSLDAYIYDCSVDMNEENTFKYGGYSSYSTNTQCIYIGYANNVYLNNIVSSNNAYETLGVGVVNNITIDKCKFINGRRHNLSFSSYNICRIIDTITIGGGSIRDTKTSYRFESGNDMDFEGLSSLVDPENYENCFGSLYLVRHTSINARKFVLVSDVGKYSHRNILIDNCKAIVESPMLSYDTDGNIVDADLYRYYSIRATESFIINGLTLAGKAFDIALLYDIPANVNQDGKEWYYDKFDNIPTVKICNINIQDPPRYLLSKLKDGQSANLVDLSKNFINYKWDDASEAWLKVSVNKGNIQDMPAYANLSEINNISVSIIDKTSIIFGTNSISCIPAELLTINILEPIITRTFFYSQGFVSIYKFPVLIINDYCEENVNSSSLIKVSFRSIDLGKSSIYVQKMKGTYYGFDIDQSVDVYGNVAYSQKENEYVKNIILSGKSLKYYNLLGISLAYNKWYIGNPHDKVLEDVNKTVDVNNTIGLQISTINADGNKTISYKAMHLYKKKTTGYSRFYFGKIGTLSQYIYNNVSVIPSDVIPMIGEDVYLTEIGKPAWYNSSLKKWVDALGNSIDIQFNGVYNDKPSKPTIGFAYFCTDKQSPESSEMGLMIYYKGSDVWVDSLGRVVDDNYPATPPATSGTTEERPLGVDPGFQYFDTTLNKPIWKSADGWVDSTGASV